MLLRGSFARDWVLFIVPRAYAAWMIRVVPLLRRLVAPLTVEGANTPIMIGIVATEIVPTEVVRAAIPPCHNVAEVVLTLPLDTGWVRVAESLTLCVSILWSEVIEY